MRSASSRSKLQFAAVCFALLAGCAGHEPLVRNYLSANNKDEFVRKNVSVSLSHLTPYPFQLNPPLSRVELQGKKIAVVGFTILLRHPTWASYYKSFPNYGLVMAKIVKMRFESLEGITVIPLEDVVMNEYYRSMYFEEVFSESLFKGGENTYSASTFKDIDYRGGRNNKVPYETMQNLAKALGVDYVLVGEIRLTAYSGETFTRLGITRAKVDMFSAEIPKMVWSAQIPTVGLKMMNSKFEVPAVAVYKGKVDQPWYEAISSGDLVEIDLEPMLRSLYETYDLIVEMFARKFQMDRTAAP